MKILIYRSGDITPLEEWVNYPTVPNVGDRIKLSDRTLTLKVTSRVFSKDIVKLIID